LRHSQNGETRILEPGHFYVVNHAVPYDTWPELAYGTQAIAFPPSALASRVPQLADFYAVQAPLHSPRCSLLGAFFEHFVANRENWTEREFERLSNQLLDLIVLAIIEPGTGAAGAESSARTAHRERALRYIRSHLSERDLSPRSIAEACGISVAYLHDVFRGSGQGVEDAIFTERLDRAHQALTAPELACVHIATIAYRCGFADPAHFSRAFRRRFGATPGDIRRGHAICRTRRTLPSVKS
jgi:AraC-like DNA-binding protein